MGRGILLWLLGIPLPIIILLLIFWHKQICLSQTVSAAKRTLPTGLKSESMAQSIRLLGFARF